MVVARIDISTEGCTDIHIQKRTLEAACRGAITLQRTEQSCANAEFRQPGHKDELLATSPSGQGSIHVGQMHSKRLRNK